MSVGCICQESVDVATAGESVYQVAARTHQRTVGSLVVVDNTNVPIGIVTDRDLVVRAIAAGRDPYTTTVVEIMTHAPKTIAANAPVQRALDVMRAGGFRRLPIVNELGHLSGIVTLDDILSQVSEELSQVARILERETPRAAAVASRG